MGCDNLLVLFIGLGTTAYILSIRCQISLICQRHRYSFDIDINWTGIRLQNDQTIQATHRAICNNNEKNIYCGNQHNFL